MLPDWLDRRAALTPDRTALHWSGGRLTFAELDRMVDRAAAACAVLGIREGERAALVAGNSPAFVISLFALMRLGAIAVPVNLRLAPAEVRGQLEDAAAAFLLYEPGRFDLDAILPPGALPISLEAIEARAPDLPDDPAAPPAPRRPWLQDAVQILIYTSGTTGAPKGAALTYGNHWWNATGSALNLGLSDSDAWLACLPLFHVGGMSILMRGVIYGTPVVLHERFDAARANAAIDDGASLVSVVSAMLQAMLDDRGERPYPPTLRAVLVGGGPVPEPLLRRAAALGMPVVQTYGLTESASQAATLSPADALRKLGSAGKPLFPVSLMIASKGDEAGAARAAAPYEVGEIRLKGPTISPGYHNRPRETEAAWQDGWFCTGDLGYLDDEGFLYVVSRRTDLIVSGGENVYPAEVESVLQDHPAVAEAAVAGRPDARWGAVPVAFIVRRAGWEQVGEAELIRFARERLAAYKAPKSIRFVAALPKNATGKLSRKEIAAWAAASGAPQTDELDPPGGAR